MSPRRRADIAGAPSPAAKPAGLFRPALGMWRTRIGLVLLGHRRRIAVIGPLVAPYGETEFVGHARTQRSVSTGTVVRHRLPRPGRARPASCTAAARSSARRARHRDRHSSSASPIGLVAAYSRGRLDDVLMRIDGRHPRLPADAARAGRRSPRRPEPWLIVLHRGSRTTPASPGSPAARRCGRRARLRRRGRGARRDARRASSGASCCPTSPARCWSRPTCASPTRSALIAALGFLGFATEPQRRRLGAR